METEVIIKRDLMDGFVRQKSKSEMLSATDLIKIGNKYRVTHDIAIFNFTAWLKNKNTILFTDELEKKFGKIIIRAGKNNIWVHPYLFIVLAMDLNPTFKVEVIGWLYDMLIKYRNNSGDSYKKMCGYLYSAYPNKQRFHFFISETALQIKKACNVTDWNDTTESKLKLRDKMHENISLLTDVLKDVDKAVEIGINKAINNL